MHCAMHCDEPGSETQMAFMRELVKGSIVTIVAFNSDGLLRLFENGLAFI
jgi:hypothetical protein